MQSAPGSLVLLAAVASIAHAQSPFDEPEPPPTKWDVHVHDDRDWLGAHGVHPDGRHLGLEWSRDRIDGDCVVVFRRELAPGVVAKPHAIKPVDRPEPGLRPAFIYPSSPREWHSAFDAKSHPIPPGAKVGEWTVVASVDHGHDEIVVDDVEPGRRYEYALVPARRADAHDTYDAFGLGVVTGDVTAEPAWFYKWRWLYLALIALIAGALGLFAWRRRRNRTSA